MNSIHLYGRLTKDPDVRYTSTGRVVTNFDMAVNRPYKNAKGERDADFFRVEIWGKAAELVGNSCKKGHRIVVHGSMRNNVYTDKAGVKHYGDVVAANNIFFVEKTAEAYKSSPNDGSFDSMGEAILQKDFEVDF